MLESDHAGNLLARSHGAPLYARRLLQEKCGRRMVDGQVVAAIAVYGNSARQRYALFHFRGLGIKVLAESGDINRSLCVVKNKIIYIF